MAELPAIPAPTEPLDPSQDFFQLRREGIGFIAEMGSDRWTDYNTHDPGITILEAVSYAMTELAYRTDLPIADILRSGVPQTPAGEPYPGQPFFTAREILTVNPTTPDDFRRLLIDLGAVRNAWVRCRTCACDVIVYAWCEHDRLTLSYDPSARIDQATPVVRVEPRGLYDVALELEDGDALGDLNDRKLVVRRTVVDTNGRPRGVTMEVRFPAWDLADRTARDLFAHGQAVAAITVSEPTRTTTDPTPMDDDALRRNWQNVSYVSFEIELADHAKVVIEHASVRMFGDRSARDATTTALLTETLADSSPAGVVGRYRAKLIAVDAAVESAKSVLESHRNLDEDYCHVRVIDVEDVAVCADVQVRPDADIELVQATIWFEIEQYLNPPIPSHFLDELVAAGTPVEAIFNGPEMSTGFLDARDLAAAVLRSVIRVSDIIDRLMEIPGVIAVENVRLTAYDAEGVPITGVADPAWNDDGSPRFDPARPSASWLLFITEGHQPRLDRNLSRFLFSSNGLPFLPRMDEAEDTLVELRGAAARPKIRTEVGNLPIPVGADRTLDSYFPVQYSFPLTYGIGPAGLPSTATALRRAQAKQLKAYLLVFEQLLRNAYAQVAHVADLFSLAPQEHTYFAAEFTDADIDGYGALVNGLDAATLARRVGDRVHRTPQPVPRSRTGSLRRGVQRVRAAADRPRGTADGPARPDRRQDRLPQGVSADHPRSREGVPPHCGPVLARQRLRIEAARRVAAGISGPVAGVGRAERARRARLRPDTGAPRPSRRQAGHVPPSGRAHDEGGGVPHGQRSVGGGPALDDRRERGPAGAADRSARGGAAPGAAAGAQRGSDRTGPR